jgi:hypothetical protein
MLYTEQLMFLYTQRRSQPMHQFTVRFDGHWATEASFVTPELPIDTNVLLCLCFVIVIFVDLPLNGDYRELVSGVGHVCWLKSDVSETIRR